MLGLQSSVINRPNFKTSFSRSQISSAIATALDYGILFLLTEKFHLWYVLATAFGAFAGALSNFLINRHWSFRAGQGRWISQAKKYAIVSTGSLILNTAGVFLVTERAHVHYAVSVIIVSIGVGFIFNYPLHRYYVYRI